MKKKQKRKEVCSMSKIKNYIPSVKTTAKETSKLLLGVLILATMVVGFDAIVTKLIYLFY